MTKLSLLGAGALLLAVAAPAFASNHNYGGSGGTMVMNVATVDSQAGALAGTGANGITSSAPTGRGHKSSGGTNQIVTGDATSNATSGVLNVNYTTLPTPTPSDPPKHDHGGSSSSSTMVMNMATVTSGASSTSGTGANGITSGGGASNYISTGDASSTSSSSVTNVNVTGF